MNSPKINRTNWNAERKLIRTQLSGEINKEEVEDWENSLNTTLDKIEDNGTFKIFLNLHGLKPVTIDTHKRFRGIIPLTLAKYGWKVGYTHLFEESNEINYSITRGIKCFGVAHCHEDNTKIELYEKLYGRDNERFFTDPILAEEWIESLIPNGVV